MNKTSLALMLFLTLCAALPASARVNLGILGGLNLANVDIDPEEGTDLSTRTAFGFGGVLEYGLSEFAVLHLEPMYLQKGTRAEEVVAGLGTVEAELALTYLEVPVFLRFDLSSSPPNPYVLVGPAIGFLLSSKVKETLGDVSVEHDVKDEMESIDFSLGFGAGVRLPAGNNFVFAEARYALGIMDISDVPGAEIKTKGFQIFAGITFPAGVK